MPGNYAILLREINILKLVSNITDYKEINFIAMTILLLTITLLSCIESVHCKISIKYFYIFGCS